ncbi:centrosomal protein of 89 kDa isoform X2 [Latimeria chalumnae]|uniref:centrosomal protein of 89 kDa isoform X2 n=1 Tax=Latimeria chalumnae TaxID=7897 RepID=UPI0006D93170|nr:PREDICTED: centrosomal protein of 89 kDa isoform X2 [Latimeria chalumnae]|eukprot:XP_014348560.1 PREDICTED: centrosomal protein of 89 kDa isoform X2 [Latimeria chalumnae]
MSFRFKKKNEMSFKHIAHGLVPAATIAPRPAVPRTPPPRSPNPSPERPRSALAAAILVTSLTGRTVAIPQPRQRSYSESDSTYTEHRRFVEPYATTTELGLRNQWRSTVSGRPRLSSPMVSDDDYEDEMEQELSDSEKEPFYHILEKEGEEGHHNDIYAVAHKEKKEEITLSLSTDTTESSIHDRSSTLPHEAKVEEFIARATAQEYKVEKQTVKNQNLSEQPAPSPVESPRTTSNSIKKIKSSRRMNLMEENKPEIETPRTTSNSMKKMKSPRKKSPMEESKPVFQDEAYQEVVDMHKEILCELKDKNRTLVTENQSLAQQLQEVTQQLQSIQHKFKQLEAKNEKLCKDMASLQGEDEHSELRFLRQQAQELVDENDALKMTVHRLNVELSRYQTKYRPLTKEEGLRISGLPAAGPVPPWLLDMKYLSPLLLSYEDRMREKDSALLAYEEEMKNFRARVEVIVRENEHFHQQIEKDGSVSSREWYRLQNQAKLVLEENQLLMEQLEVQQAKAKDSHNSHVQEVSKLTKKLMLLEAEKHNQQEELLELKQQLETLRPKYQQLRASLDNKVEVDEHMTILSELQRRLQQEEDKRHQEVEDLMGRIAALQTEKKSLLLEKTNLVADNKILETELEMARKTNRKSQKKMGVLKEQVEDAMEKEVAAHQYLANLISLAEKTAQERDQLIYMAKSLENEKHGVLSKIMEGNVRLGKLQEKVKLYKKKAATKLGDIDYRMKEQEEDFAGKTAQYQREIKHLQRLLQDKQETLDEVLQQKRQVEGELEVVWESTSLENRRMKNLLYESLQKYMQDPDNTFVFDKQEVPQRDQAGGSNYREFNCYDALPSLQRNKLGVKKPCNKYVTHNEYSASIENIADTKGNTSTQAKKSKPKERIVKSPMFESDSDQQLNASSDESEKNGHDFYS